MNRVNGIGGSNIENNSKSRAMLFEKEERKTRGRFEIFKNERPSSTRKNPYVCFVASIRLYTCCTGCAVNPGTPINLSLLFIDFIID